MLSWEKPLVKSMAPGSIFHHNNLPSTSYFYCRLFCNLYFPIYTKIPKIFILLSLSDLTFISDREGIDNPFIALVARLLIVCVGTRRLACSLLLDWYLGSRKTEGNTYATIAASPSPLRGKPTQAQDIARRISGAFAGESTQKVNIPSTHHNPYLSHYIICHLPLVFLSP